MCVHVCMYVYEADSVFFGLVLCVYVCVCVCVERVEEW